MLEPEAILRVVVVVTAVGTLWSSIKLAVQLCHKKDPQRVYSRSELDEIRRRCGNRCECKPLFWLRCNKPFEQGDHVIPHSRRGRTTLGNSQGACGDCNLRKSARMPFRFETWRLSRRRRSYFPPGVPTKVDRPWWS